VRARPVARFPGREVCSLALGDVDGDGLPEIFSGTAPDSGLYLHRYDREGDAFRTILLGERLSGRDSPVGRVSNILVTDINGDGANEIVAITDQPGAETPMKMWVFSRQGGGWLKSHIQVQVPSRRTQGLVAFDTDGDGIQEIFTAHAGHGEVLRFSLSGDLKSISWRQVRRLWAPGESLEVADVFNTGRKDLVVAQGADRYNAAVKVYAFTRDGLAPWPVVSLDGHRGRRFWDATTCTGDLDDDGRNEIVVAWLFPRSGLELTVVAYHFDPDGRAARSDVLLEYARGVGAGTMEGRMAIGRNGLYLSGQGIYRCDTDGRGKWRCGRVWPQGRTAARTGPLVVGDVDGDGRTEVICAALPPFSGGGWCIVMLSEGGGS